MPIVQLVGHYFLWHYSAAIINLFRVWKNMLWFCFHFFSVPLLTRTLFSPWKRISEEKSPGFDLQEIMEVLVVNVMMRIVGFFLRSILIVVGLCATAIVFVLGLVIAAIWILAPLLVFVAFVYGIVFLFK